MSDLREIIALCWLALWSVPLLGIAVVGGTFLMVEGLKVLERAFG
jgi:hypothetical protein